MTSATTFQTARGTDIQVRIVTERANLADHTVMSPCYELEVWAGRDLICSPDLIDHPEQRRCIASRFADIRNRRVVVPIPADKVSAVEAIFAEYETETLRRWAAEDEAGRKFEEGRRELRRVMGPGHFDDAPDYRTTERD